MRDLFNWFFTEEFFGVLDLQYFVFVITFFRKKTSIRPSFLGIKVVCINCFMYKNSHNVSKELLSELVDVIGISV